MACVGSEPVRGETTGWENGIAVPSNRCAAVAGRARVHPAPGTRMGPIATRAWQVLEENDPEDRLNRAVDGALLGLILLSVLGAVLATVHAIEARFSAPLAALERMAVLVFSAEYLARVWAAPVDPRYRGAVRGRLRYVLTPMAVVDLLAVLPCYLAAAGVGLGFTEALRVFRIFRLIKALRYMPGAGILWQVARSKREELLVAAVSLGILLLAASSLMFYAEHDLQPREFSSIPATMWWAVATVTTVGYGDVYPMTPLGRVLGSAVAILGIGFFALPTAILGSGFVEAFSRRRAPPCCPHCGRETGERRGDTAGGDGRRRRLTDGEPIPEGWRRESSRQAEARGAGGASGSTERG